MYTFRESRAYARYNGAYQTPRLATPFARGPGTPSALNTEAELGGSDHSRDLDETLVLDPQKYGSIVTLTGLVSGNDQVFLQQPRGLRTFLLIQNINAIGNIFVGFGQPAGSGGIVTTHAIRISPLGNLFMDAFVSQDEIHLWTDTPNLGVVILYCNQNAFALQ